MNQVMIWNQRATLLCAHIAFGRLSYNYGPFWNGEAWYGHPSVYTSASEEEQTQAQLRTLLKTGSLEIRGSTKTSQCQISLSSLAIESTVLWRQPWNSLHLSTKVRCKYARMKLPSNVLDRIL